MASEQAPDGETGRLLDVLARRERGRLIAGLVSRLGTHHLTLAEDVAQEALLAALSVWPYAGIPDNPAAWLTRVARNKAIDRLRRLNREQPYDPIADARDAAAETAPFEIQPVADPELRLIFLSCHPALDGVDRLALTLRIVSGFTARELASIFLSTEAAIAQRLSRSKRRLRSLDSGFTESPAPADIRARLDPVLKVLYLMFSVGYAPRTGEQLIRRDVALEAVRLACELAHNAVCASPPADALAALLCLQASRLDAREDAAGRPILFRDQDRGRWDRELIMRGMAYLRRAMQGEEVTRYHLEAGIASVYATTEDWDHIDWSTILGYYAHLEQIVDSPVVTINACVAQAFAGDAMEACARLDGLRSKPLLESYAPFHIARAEVLRLAGREREARASYAAAIESGASVPVIEYLEDLVGGKR